MIIENDNCYNSHPCLVLWRWSLNIRSKKLHTGCGRRNTTLIVFIEEHFIQSFIQSNIESTSVQAICTRATLICFDLSRSILLIKLLTCNRNGEINLPLSYSTIRYPVDLPDKQCLWALTLTPKCLIPSFSYIYGWPLVNTGKNDKKGKPWAAIKGVAEVA